MTKLITFNKCDDCPHIRRTSSYDFVHHCSRTGHTLCFHPVENYYIIADDCPLEDVPRQPASSSSSRLIAIFNGEGGC